MLLIHNFKEDDAMIRITGFTDNQESVEFTTDTDLRYAMTGLKCAAAVVYDEETGRWNLLAVTDENGEFIDLREGSK